MKSVPDIVIRKRLIERCKPHPLNPRTHPQASVDAIAASLNDNGQVKPIVINKQGFILAGHGVWMAAKKLGWRFVFVVAVDLSEAQQHRLLVQDNSTAMFSDWDWDALKELALDPLTDFAPPDASFFEGDALKQGSQDAAARADVSAKFQNVTQSSLIYTPSGTPPALGELADTAKRDELVAEIQGVPMPDDVRAFLELAATRHVRFSYSKVADFYAHAAPDVKRLFERSLLVFLDNGGLLEAGVQKLMDEVAAARASEGGSL